MLKKLNLRGIKKNKGNKIQIEHIDVQLSKDYAKTMKEQFGISFTDDEVKDIQDAMNICYNDPEILKCFNEALGD